jgi:AcrR family transcriptional regulator
MSAVERRADVLRAAVAEFAKGGYYGTSTEDVARAAGISQPYLFRLFPTKKALFLALVEHGFGRVREAFVEAVGDRTGEDAMAAMGDAYGDLLRDRDELLLQMHCYSACDDDEIAAAVRREFGRLWREIVRLSGADDEKMQQFFAMGMLMNVIAAMDATSHRSDWIKACIPPSWLMPTSWDEDTATTGTPVTGTTATDSTLTR